MAPKKTVRKPAKPKTPPPPSSQKDVPTRLSIDVAASASDDTHASTLKLLDQPVHEDIDPAVAESARKIKDTDERQSGSAVRHLPDALRHSKKASGTSREDVADSIAVFETIVEENVSDRIPGWLIITVTILPLILTSVLVLYEQRIYTNHVNFDDENRTVDEIPETAEKYEVSTLMVITEQLKAEILDSMEQRLSTLTHQRRSATDEVVSHVQIVQHSAVVASLKQCSGFPQWTMHCVLYGLISPLLRTRGFHPVHPLANQLIFGADNHNEQCFALKGVEGHVLIAVPDTAQIHTITFTVPRSQHESAALLKEFKLTGHGPNLVDIVYRSLHVFSKSDKTPQSFPILSNTSIHYLQLQVVSNHGHRDYTCLPRLQLHRYVSE